MYLYLFVVLCALVGISEEDRESDSCCLRIPPPMDINVFESKVADGGDWVEILYLPCPVSETEAELTQFRAKYSLQGGQLTRTRNFRSGDGSCAGVRDNLYEQVGCSKAAFESTNSENVTREDRFFSRCVDDYIIWTVCYDVRDLDFRRRKCSGPHFISVMIKQDPPTNFPWDKLMWELRTLARDVRKLIFSYIGEPCPVL